jgi:hypothetical protein
MTSRRTAERASASTSGRARSAAGSKAASERGTLDSTELDRHVSSSTTRL